MQSTDTIPGVSAYARVLISRSSAGLPRTHRLMRRPAPKAGLFTALLRVLR